MRLYRNILAICGFVFLPITASATSPETLDVALSQDLQSVSVSGRHPTQVREEHYIRRVRVTINQDQPVTTYLTRQNSAKEFKVNIPVEAKPGDEVKVEVFCSQGGSKMVTVKIPKAADDEVKPIDQVVDLKSLKDSDHPTMPIVP